LWPLFPPISRWGTLVGAPRSSNTACALAGVRLTSFTAANENCYLSTSPQSIACKRGLFSLFSQVSRAVRSLLREKKGTLVNAALFRAFLTHRCYRTLFCLCSGRGPLEVEEGASTTRTCILLVLLLGVGEKGEGGGRRLFASVDRRGFENASTRPRPEKGNA
jgi:hypothetical protein